MTSCFSPCFSLTRYNRAAQQRRQIWGRASKRGPSAKLVHLPPWGPCIRPEKKVRTEQNAYGWEKQREEKGGGGREEEEWASGAGRGQAEGGRGRSRKIPRPSFVFSRHKPQGQPPSGVHPSGPHRGWSLSWNPVFSVGVLWTSEPQCSGGILLSLISGRPGLLLGREWTPDRTPQPARLVIQAGKVWGSPLLVARPERGALRSSEHVLFL